VASRLSHRIFLGAGVLLLVLDHQHGFGPLSRRLWPPSLFVTLVGLGLTIVGVAFAIWARETLGRYWSGTITLKEGHRVIMTGPYRLARHPIYSGLLLAFTGTALARRDIASFLGVALVAVGMARKIVIEERILTQHFANEYVAYRQQVKTIIPFIL
jgi:protein-S-isoprenylcysteine O-methyltransferase Ste14